MNISYDWYRIFAAVAECQSITAAAERLFISQPAVSRCIRQLEEAVGCRLFERVPKGVRLTREGELLFSHVSDGISAFSAGERKLISMMRLDVGEIRIGASDMTLEFCLLPHLEAFHALYPGVKISITNQPTPATLSLLGEEKIDFGVVSEPFEFLPKNEIEVTRVLEIRDIFIVGRSLADSFRGALKISELPSDQLIMLEKKTSTRAYLDAEFKERAFFAEPKFELATSALIVRFAARNLGVGCVVGDFARAALASGEVSEIDVSDPLPPRHISIVRRKSDNSRAALALVKMILSGTPGFDK